MSRLILSLAALAIATPALAEDAFPALAFLQLPPPEHKANAPFPWPAKTQFEAAWAGARDARLIRVIEADMASEAGPQRVLLAIETHERGLVVRAMGGADAAATRSAEERFWSGTPWALEGKLVAGQAAQLTRDDEVAALKVVRASPAGRATASDLWSAYSYVAVLLEQSPARPEEFPIPMGRCSMDIGPQQAAREHAETCFSAGRMGCFLDFQIRIMGDQFRRVAASSYGERAHGTESARLLDAGVDVERLLVGLLARYQTPQPRRRELSAWRLARAIAELERDDLPERIALIADDVGTDEFNRLRATQILAFVAINRARAAGQYIDLESIAKMTQDFLQYPSWSSKLWLAALPHHR